MPAGRPTKLTADIIQKVKTFLPVCMYIETLADSLEIDRQTFYNWFHRGEAEAKRLDKRARPWRRSARHCTWNSSAP